MENAKITVTITQKEYENLRYLANKEREKFLVKYTKQGILFTACSIFLTRLGFFDF